MLHHSNLYIDLLQIARNALMIKSTLPPGTRLIPVLKGNAYGMGAREIYTALADARDTRPNAMHYALYAVAHVSEAHALREAGYDKDILLLGGAPKPLLRDIVELGVTPAVYGGDTARALSAEAARQGKTDYPVQIKIDAGLRRLGVRPDGEAMGLAQTLRRLGNLRVTGAYTHFSLLDTMDETAARRELARFLRAVGEIEDAGIPIPMRHAAASAVSEWFPEANLDAVRIGRRLYMGPPPFPNAPPDTGLIGDAVSWRGSVLETHTLSKGARAGYGGSFTAPRDMEVA
ncbi:MAG: alanine racemase, partial [Oscillospiraceae bacterium]|nr:alanine racemase [Oscillospiraceae bacterium]